jgi:predicted aspartyl protease
MISGQFGENKELFFEIGLVTASGEELFVEALFDTGFTDGWLAINRQDLDALGWSLITSQVELATAGGEAQFDIYEGKVIIDSTSVIIPVHVGDDLPDTLMGAFWLDMMRLVADKPNAILMLEMV